MVAKIFALAYFFSRMDGSPNAEYLTTFSDLCKSANESTFPFWIRPAATVSGLSPYRLGPAHKFGWWFRTTSNMDWLIGEETALRETQNKDSAHLVLTLKADRTEARPGDTIQYTLTYKNAGTAGARGVMIRVPIYLLNARPELQVPKDGVSDGGKVTSTDVAWHIGDVSAGGGPRTLSFRARVGDYPVPATEQQPLAPVAARATAFYCRAGANDACQLSTNPQVKGIYCHSNISEMVATERHGIR